MIWQKTLTYALGVFLAHEYTALQHRSEAVVMVDSLIWNRTVRVICGYGTDIMQNTEQHCNWVHCLSLELMSLDNIQGLVPIDGRLIRTSAKAFFKGSVLESMVTLNHMGRGKLHVLYY